MMFKQFKSAFIWYAIFKWRKRLSIVAFLLLIMIFSFVIYDDIVAYLRLTNQLEYLKYLLLAKWLIVFSSIFSSLFLLKNIWKENLLAKQQSKEKRKQQEEELCLDLSLVHSCPYVQRAFGSYLRLSSPK